MSEVVERLAQTLSLHPRTVQQLAGKILANSPEARTLEDLRKKMHPVQYNQFIYNLSHVERSQRTFDLARRAVETFPTNPTMLDVGCGLGGALIAFGKHGFELHGIELGERAREICRDNLAYNNLTAELTAEDLCYSNLGGKKFDVVVCNSVVEHVEDPESFIARFEELINPGGVLVLGVANCEALGNLISDPHYQLFGMTLLDRHDSAQLYKIFAKVPQHYSVTDWYPIREYAAMIERSVGPVELIPPENETRGSEAVPSLLSRFFAGLDQALREPKLSALPALSGRLKEKSVDYARDVCDEFLRIHDNEAEEKFKNRYIRKSFQFVSVKS